MVLDEIPHHRAGKIDRAALLTADRGCREYREPATVTERRIAALFSEQSSRPSEGDDSFFDRRPRWWPPNTAIDRNAVSVRASSG